MQFRLARPWERWRPRRLVCAHYKHRMPITARSSSALWLILNSPAFAMASWQDALRA
jgi:hypothetical protein